MSGGAYAPQPEARTFVGSDDPTSHGVTPAAGDVWIHSGSASSAPHIIDSTIGTTTSGPSIPVAVPSCQPGDWLYIGVVYDGTNNTVAPPAGISFELVGTADDGGEGYVAAYVAVYRRLIDGSEGATLTFTISEDDQQAVLLACSVRGAVAEMPVVSTAIDTPTATITPSAPASLLIGFQGSGSSAVATQATPPTGWTELQDGNAQFFYKQGSLAYYTPTSTSPVTASWSDIDDSSELLVAISPVATTVSSVRTWVDGAWV